METSEYTYPLQHTDRHLRRDSVSNINKIKLAIDADVGIAMDTEYHLVTIV